MKVLRAANLGRLPGIAHGFFGRTGGVSRGVYESLNCGPGSGDERAHVIENRRRVVAALAPGAALVTLGQVHGTNAIRVEKAWTVSANREDDVKTIPLGDAMASNVPGIALGILTADCAPVLLADPDARVIGAAHAGWKGALAGVVESVLAAMESLGAKRARVNAAIGPCIAQANYEVGPELQARFVETDSANARFFVPSHRASHYLFDLEGYVSQRLRDAGVKDVEALSACTYARDAEFFSFRRTTHRGERDYGREISAILLSK